MSTSLEADSMDDELLAIRTRRLEELKKATPAAAQGAARREPVDLTAATLPTFLENHPIALVDVWAVWCGPCRMMEPIIEDLADELSGRVGVGKVDADHNYDVMQAYGIQGIPTFLFFKNGAFAGKMVGARPKRDLLDAVRQLEAASPEPDQSVQ